MKLKLKVLLVFVLGIFSCATLGVSASEGSSEFNIPDGSESGSSFSSSYSSDGGSRVSRPSSPMEETETKTESPGTSFKYWFTYPSNPMQETETAAPAEGAAAAAASMEEVSLCDDETDLCKDFDELLARLREKQNQKGVVQIGSVNCPEGEDGWSIDCSRYTYWMNSTLNDQLDPKDPDKPFKVNLFNKWFGDNLQRSKGKLPNGVAALLPTGGAFLGHVYTIDALRRTVLDVSNWRMYKGMQTFDDGICQELGAECRTFESYVTAIRSKGARIV